MRLVLVGLTIALLFGGLAPVDPVAAQTKEPPPPTPTEKEAPPTPTSPPEPTATSPPPTNTSPPPTATSAPAAPTDAPAPTSPPEPTLTPVASLMPSATTGTAGEAADQPLLATRTVAATATDLPTPSATIPATATSSPEPSATPAATDAPSPTPAVTETPAFSSSGGTSDGGFPLGLIIVAGAVLVTGGLGAYWLSGRRRPEPGVPAEADEAVSAAAVEDAGAEIETDDEIEGELEPALVVEAKPAEKKQPLTPTGGIELAEGVRVVIEGIMRPRPSEEDEQEAPAAVLGGPKTIEAQEEEDEPEFELLEDLTDREMDVLKLLAAGLTQSKIAQALHVSVNTVQYHRRNLYSKLGASNRDEAVERARKLGLIPPAPH